MNKIKPNFFIIGAPKSGTTALSEYLREHDNVVISDPKETHFFTSDMLKMRTTDNEQTYLNYFKNISDKTIAIGDASVWYLYSKEAIRNVFKFNSMAKIIVMLRNPLEMVPSMHAQHLISTDEDINDFETAWGLNRNRENGKSIPKYCRAPQNIVYSKIALYSEQLDRLYQYFPKEQVKIILFEDFKEDTRKVYNEVLDFLGVLHEERDDFPVINQNTASKSYWLKTLVVNQPKGLILLKNMIKFILKKDQLNIASAINELNTKKVKRKPLNEKLKQEMINNYIGDIKRLSIIINRDLNNWTK
ncbi:sulfotransferase [Lutimonas halocynthiae]|uniref:sulfotransferase family protein n=1 Tax=Lutimonas halocynthiae TaxID=1446477 RepID=UPI0025B47533|nr:sulfotransferase [Lutimonas halocynthiae]MDN3641075.1 sulfotransferase [Lutimonas halocynthiae]